jgi:hypothetical protein
MLRSFALVSETVESAYFVKTGVLMELSEQQRECAAPCHSAVTMATLMALTPLCMCVCHLCRRSGIVHEQPERLRCVRDDALLLVPLRPSVRPSVPPSLPPSLRPSLRPFLRPFLPLPLSV